MTPVAPSSARRCTWTGAQHVFFCVEASRDLEFDSSPALKGGVFFFTGVAAAPVPRR